MPLKMYWVLVALAAWHTTAFAQELTTVESGTFLIFQAGKQIGTDVYLHQRGGGRSVWSGTIRLHSQGAEIRQEPRLELDENGRPVRMDLKFSVGGPEQQLNYEFGEKTFVMKVKGPKAARSEEHPLPENPVILANSVFHHNIPLSRRYDWGRGGRQEFTAVPDTRLAMEGRGEDSFSRGDATIRLRHLRLTLSGSIEINLWIDGASGRILKMDIPVQKAVIFLEGFQDLKPVPAEPAPPGP